MLWWIVGYTVGAFAMLGCLLAVTTKKALREPGGTFAVLVCMAIWPLVIVTVLTMDVVRRMN